MESRGQEGGFIPGTEMSPMPLGALGRGLLWLHFSWPKFIEFFFTKP